MKEKRVNFKEFWKTYKWCKKTFPKRNPIEAAAGNQGISFEQAQKIVTDAANYRKNSTVELSEIFNESERAVMLIAMLSSPDGERERYTDVWIPKSQITDNNIPEWLYNKKVKEVNAKFDRYDFCCFITK